ncbi:AsnC family protein [Actinomadura sp. WMMB 499]|uniref:AsnC family protein n=1 Tax=Actinomadura sp. WMMB 499 TaxID=1219491 RepID=UPI0020C80039|nr:AsnC family protein [Actinomadura sp. WMMB 499]
MHTSGTLDELDHQLVTALQTAPRADWRRIGAALGVDGSTAARRWARLSGAGLAWLACYPVAVEWVNPVVAFIEIDCSPNGCTRSPPTSPRTRTCSTSSTSPAAAT